jgi:regulator of replication initiation timing
MSKEAMKLALEVKESMEDVLESVNALVAENKALKEALAKQEQGEPFFKFRECEDSQANQLKQEQGEPVGQLLEDAFGRGQVMWFNKPKDESMLYTTPQQRTWVGLSDEERKDLFKRNEEQFYDELNYAEAIEAKLKEKNT